MFEKRDYRMYQGIKRENIYPQVCEFWSRQGFYVAQLAPFQIQGSSYYQKIGLRREFYLRMDEHQGNIYIDIFLRARITDEGAIGGAAAAVIFWPVAVVGGALSYHEYENDANALIYNFWMYVDQLTQQRGVYPNAWSPPAPLPPPTPQPAQHSPQQQPVKTPVKEKVSRYPPSTPPPIEVPQTSKTTEREQCKGCGALLLADWKACPYCGKSKN